MSNSRRRKVAKRNLHPLPQPHGKESAKKEQVTSIGHVGKSKYAAKIYVSPFREPPERAIKTILKLFRYFSSVHLVSETVTLNSQLYRNWTEHKRLLNARHIQLVHHTQWDVGLVRENVVIHIPSLVQFREATFKQLDRQIQRIPFTDQPRHAIMPMTDLGAHGFSLWYILLALVFCLDWWRQLFAWFTFHTEEHICAEEVLRGNRRTVMHHHRSPGWCSCCGALGWLRGKRDNGDRTPLIYAASNAIGGPTRRISGMKYFLLYMHNRTTFGPGWKWWFVIATTLYFVLGIAWWGPLWMAVWKFSLGLFGYLVGGQDAVEVGIKAMAVWSDPIGLPRMVLMVIFALIHTLVLVRHFRWPYHRIWVAWTFPLAFPLLFPFIMAWSRLYQMHETWDHAADTVEEYEQDEVDDADDLDPQPSAPPLDDDTAERIIHSLGISQSHH